MKTNESIISDTETWLLKAVIGLNLCPFAKAVQIKKQIRYHVSAADNKEQLLRDLIIEMQNLVKADPLDIDTTLLIHPMVLTDFYDYNDFLETADAALVELNLEGVLQVASFHPQYQFEDTDKEDISNYTNRSPYPMLHLLREDSVTKAIDSYPDIDSVPDKNIETLIALGLDGWNKLGIPKG